MSVSGDITHQRYPQDVSQPASSLRFRWIFTELVVVTLALLTGRYWVVYHSIPWYTMAYHMNL